MAKIEILPEQIANKIAAGEVVQRPESVVKELLENAIDAGGTRIDLLIKRSGKSLIQVIDDGEGMTEEDAILSIQKHATSKIKNAEDLDAIKTLGFRGEALSAITAVSQIEIRTKTKGAELGCVLRSDGGSDTVVEKGAFPHGTSVSVKNLFFNTPARRNFLRTDATEMKHIVDSFNKTALAHPALAFKLYIDDEIILDYPAGERDDRIIAVFGEVLYRSLFYVEELTDYLSLRGYIGKPSLLKKSKGDQYVFINDRPIQSKQVNHAVFSAYEHILEKGEYPFFVLYITLDPSKVDVNVHPSKLEVRFENEKDIYAFILTVLKKGLAQYDLVPNISLLPRDGSDETKTIFTHQGMATRSDFSDRPRPASDYKPRSISDAEIDAVFGSLRRHAEQPLAAGRHPMPFGEPFDAVVQPLIPVPAVQVVHSEIPPVEYDTFLIQLQNKYILTPIKSGLMIIDQHVAHERILYEKAMRSFDSLFPLSQQLLFPKTIELDPGMYLTVKELSQFLLRIGFEIKFFGRNTVVIEGVPQEIKPGEEENNLRGIIEEYIDNQKVRKISDEKDNLAKSYACKSAIKAGDKLSEKEMRMLIDELFATSMPYVCPHGRPVVVKISIEEFDKRFGRT